MESRSNQDWSDWVSFSEGSQAPRAMPFSRLSSVPAPIFSHLLAALSHPARPLASMFSAKVVFLPETLKAKKPHHLAVVKRRDEAVLQPQADAIILHCIFLRSMSRAAAHAQSACCAPTYWPKSLEAALQSPFSLFICKCPEFITSMLKTVLLPLKIFPNTFSHCMLKTFLASKCSPLPPPLVVVKAWTGRTDPLSVAVHGDVCYLSWASDSPYAMFPGIIYCTVAFWGAKGGTAAQRLKELHVFE